MDAILEEFDRIRKDHEERGEEQGECNHCKSKNSWLQDGNITCRSCHTVTSRQLDSSAEWRSYFDPSTSYSKDKTRCGLPVSDLLPQTSFSSRIAYSGGESNDIRGMRKYQFWSSLTYAERSTIKTFDALTLGAANNGISKSVIEQAKVYFKQLSSKGMIMRGANKSGIIASSIFMACKQEGVPRSSQEVAKMFDVDTSVITRGCRLFREMLPDEHSDMEPCGAMDFVGRFCSKLNMDTPRMQEVAKEVIKRLTMTMSNDYTPMSLVAGCIMFCAHEKSWPISKRDVSRVCDVSVVTIGKIFKVLNGAPPHNPARAAALDLQCPTGRPS